MAQGGRGRQRRSTGLILGADTICVVDGEILNKPLDRADAERMIRLQEGRNTHVISGICLYHVDRHEWVGAVEVSVVLFSRSVMRIVSPISTRSGGKESPAATVFKTTIRSSRLPAVVFPTWSGSPSSGLRLCYRRIRRWLTEGGRLCERNDGRERVVNDQNPDRPMRGSDRMAWQPFGPRLGLKAVANFILMPLLIIGFAIGIYVPSQEWLSPTEAEAAMFPPQAPRHRRQASIWVPRANRRDRASHGRFTRQ